MGETNRHKLIKRRKYTKLALAALTPREFRLVALRPAAWLDYLHGRPQAAGHVIAPIDPMDCGVEGHTLRSARQTRPP